MAMRYLKASIPSGSNYQLYDGDERTFSLSSYDSPVYGNCKVKSIYVNFSRMRHGSNDYYVEIDIDGVLIGETERKDGLLDTSTTVSHTMWFDPEMDEWQNALTETGSITVRCIINAGSGYLALRGGCEITVGVEYEEESYEWISAPSIKSVSQLDGKFSLSWNPASWSGPGSIWYYVNSNPSGPGDWLANTSSTSASNIAIPAYGAVTLSVSATEYDTYTSISGSKSVTFYKPSLNAPTNFKINNSTSYTGTTAPLTWTQGALNYTSGTRTYEIYKGSTLVHTTGASATSYTIPESITKDWGTSAVTLKIRGKGTNLGDTTSGSTIYSSYTGTVSYTYRASVSTHPSGLKVNGGTSYTGTTAPLTWSAAAFSGGQTPTYSIRVNGTELTTTTNTSYTIPESTTKSYTSAVTITIVAIGGGTTSNATNGVTYTYSPTITAPSGLKINNTTSYTGRTAPLTWTAGSLSNEGIVTYSIRKNGTEFATTTSTSYTVEENVTKDWGASAVTITVVATGSGKTSSASNEVTYTYQPAFTANPSGLKINGGSSYTGQTAPLTWTAATISNGATITYTIYNGSTSVATTTSTSYTIPEITTRNWTNVVTLTVKASASGITSEATSGVTYTYSPAIIAPSNLKINGETSFIGQSASLTWTAGSLSNEAAITYSLRKDDVQFATTTDTFYTIPESIASKWGTNAVTITVVAVGGGKTSSASNGVTFTYKTPFKTIKYYNDTTWTECIAYYHNGTKWVKCDLYYHDGTKWNLSDH